MPVSAAPQRRIAAAPAQTQPAMPAPGGAPVAAEPAEDPAMQATRAAAELAADLARLQKVRDKAKPGARTALDATIKVVSGKLGAAELAAKRAEAERVAKAKQAEDAAQDAADTQGRLGQFAAGLGALSEDDRRRVGSTAQIREMHRAVQAGATPEQVLSRALRPDDSERGEGRAVSDAAEVKARTAARLPLPSRLMSQDQKDAAWEERLVKRAELYRAYGVEKSTAAMEAKKDNDVERKINRFLWVYDNQAGRHVLGRIPWEDFSPNDRERAVRLWKRGELDDEAADQMMDAPMGTFPYAQDGGGGSAPPASAPPASEPQAAGGVKAQVDAIMADGSLSVEEKRRRLEALRAGS
jgi:hypothetical protein